jgi:hypothetical protein
VIGRNTPKIQSIIFVGFTLSKHARDLILTYQKKDMDSRTKSLYCQACGDFVYDYGLERLCRSHDGSIISGSYSKFLLAEVLGVLILRFSDETEDAQ